jgi:uncharacterized protein (TIGR00725 family)
MLGPYIGVIGQSERHGPVSPNALEMAEETGREIAARGGVLVCGGLDGVMEAAARGSKRAGGLTVGLLPGLDKESANSYVDVRIATGLGIIRNHLIVRTSDAVIMIAGGIGTLNEVTLAYQAKPVVVLETTGGWAGRLRSVALDGAYLEDAHVGRLHYARDPASAVALAYDLVSHQGS